MDTDIRQMELHEINHCGVKSRIIVYDHDGVMRHSGGSLVLSRDSFNNRLALQINRDINLISIIFLQSTLQCRGTKCGVKNAYTNIYPFKRYSFSDP